MPRGAWEEENAPGEGMLGNSGIGGPGIIGATGLKAGLSGTNAGPTTPGYV